MSLLTSASRLWFLLPLVGICALPACGAADQEDQEASGDAISAPGQNDLPWEVRSRSGETYLANVFYAEASQNEQIMPTTIGGRHQIDRLVYPTLGNPNLFVKADTTDEFMMVTRIENELLAPLHATTDRPVEGSRSLLNYDLPADVKSDPANGLHVFLVERSARASATAANSTVSEGAGVIEIAPSAIHAHSVPSDMPAAFKARQTLRLVFDNAAMAKVPAGLYDVRLEIRKDGKIAQTSGVNKGAFEYQYNALKVFDKISNDYSIINVTDTQVSHSAPGRGPEIKTSFEKVTLSHLKEFVQRVNKSTEADVRNAAFITFNGDLHDGGSPEALRPSRVAWTYNDEATVILDTLKDLSVPIFLTAGNHDGYASTGQVPAAIDNMLGKFIDWTMGTENGTLFGTINAVGTKEWPNFDINAYKKFLDATKEQAGGKHVDLHSGAHRRMAGVDPSCGSSCFKSGWLEVARSKRNYVLYDGVYQWQRTYGPTYASWSFGKSKFVNLNTYELRQHRRTGWGMYTVNYGGGMSQVQVEWAKKELDGAEAAGQDVVVIGHHDARGGHNGKDYPYYFKPLEYRGMDQSAANYVKGEILNPKICDLVPEWAQTKDTVLTCLHDGLQEWMRAESEFDCTDKNRFRDARGSVDGMCDEASYSGSSHPWYSGYELMDLVMLHPSVRTMILGHTHYNSLEVLQSGQKMVPTTVTLDAIAQQQHEASENTNPLRAFSLFKEKKIDGAYDPKFVTPGLAKNNETVNLAQAGHAFANHTIMGQGRELVIMRVTSNADMTTQKYIGANKNSKDGDKMYGFATLRVTAKSDGRGYALPQINEITFYMNEETGRFEAVEKKSIERAKAIKGAQTDPANPYCQMFRGSGAEACK